MPEFALREHDYVVGHHKIAGNAQSISGKRWVLHPHASSVQLADFCEQVHHTSFLWDVNPAAMRLIKNPKKQPDYRAKRPHTSFLKGLSEWMADREAFSTAVTNRLEQVHMLERCIWV